MGPSKLRSSISLTRGRADQALEGGSKVVFCPHKFCNTMQFRAGRPAKVGLKMARPGRFLVRFRASFGILAEKFCSSTNFADDTDGFCVHFGDFLGVEKPRFLSQITQKSVVGTRPRSLRTKLGASLQENRPFLWEKPDSFSQSPTNFLMRSQIFSVAHKFFTPPHKFFKSPTNFFVG